MSPTSSFQRSWRTVVGVPKFRNVYARKKQINFSRVSSVACDMAQSRWNQLSRRSKLIFKKLWANIYTSNSAYQTVTGGGCMGFSVIFVFENVPILLVDEAEPHTYTHNFVTVQGLTLTSILMFHH